MTMSNTNTQRAFTTTTSGSTHRPMASANDGFFSYHPAMQGPPMPPNHYGNSAAMTTTQRYCGQPYQNVYGPPPPPPPSQPPLLLVPPSTAGFANRPPTLPAGQTRLRFVDCLAWMVTTMTEGQDHQQPQHNKPLVWWSADGRALYFRLDKESEEQLSNAIRPFFKHGNWGSVRRQLFSYGFTKPLQGPNKKGFQHKYFRRGELVPEKLKLIIRKSKGGKHSRGNDGGIQSERNVEAKFTDKGGKRLDEDNDEDLENAPSPSSCDEQSDTENMMTLHSATTDSDEDGGILPGRKSMNAKQTKKTSRAVSLDQSDMAAVAGLKSLRAVSHQSIIDGHYQQQQHTNKENNSTPSRTPPLPDYRQEAKDPLRAAPYVLYPSESGGGAVKVTREWYVQTIQNTAASHCDVLVI